MSPAERRSSANWKAVRRRLIALGETANGFWWRPDLHRVRTGIGACTTCPYFVLPMPFRLGRFALMEKGNPWGIVLGGIGALISSAFAWWVGRRKSNAEAKAVEASAESVDLANDANELKNVDQAIAIWRREALEWRAEAIKLRGEVVELTKHVTTLEGKVKCLEDEGEKLRSELHTLKTMA